MEVLCIQCMINTSDDSIICDLPICKTCYTGMLKAEDEYENKRVNFYPEIDKIDENIYLGNKDTALDEKLLLSYNINTIFVIGNGLKMKFPDRFKYFKYELNDSLNENIKSHFKSFCQQVNEEIKSGNKIYVHCSAGVSRSSTMVISYFMYKDKLTFEDSFQFVKSKRSIICPNSSFVNQLKEFENILLQNDYNIEKLK
jgi:protein tyrosine phosphatase